MKIMKLTKENAGKANYIRNIAHPEWGDKKFNYNEQPLLNGEFCSTWGRGSNGAVLFESEYQFWEVVS
jgi:hypothetical protein